MSGNLVTRKVLPEWEEFGRIKVPKIHQGCDFIFTKNRKARKKSGNRVDFNYFACFIAFLCDNFLRNESGASIHSLVKNRNSGLNRNKNHIPDTWKKMMSGKIGIFFKCGSFSETTLDGTSICLNPLVSHSPQCPSQPFLRNSQLVFFPIKTSNRREPGFS